MTASERVVLRGSTILCDGLTWAEGAESVWFLGAQVNMARFACNLQYSGTFDWLLSG